MAVSTPLGIKRICPSCNARFYDLNRRPAACPKCAHTYDPTVQVKPRRARRAAVDTSGEQDLLLQHMNKTKIAPKPKKEKEDVEIEDFGGIEPAVEEDLEALDDIEQLEELEDIEEPDETEEEIALEEGVIVDEVEDDVEIEEESGEEEEEKPKRGGKKAAAKKRK